MLLFKLTRNLLPENVSSLTPQLVSQKTTYMLRNTDHLVLMKARTTLYQNSFLPSTIQTWNSLPEEVREIATLNEFKRYFNKHDPKTPQHYYAGKRFGQIIHARLRMECSKLNEHLFHMHIIESPKCDCGHPSEDTDHFLWECPLHDNFRHILYQMDPKYIGDSWTLLFGDRNANSQENSRLFKIVSKYLDKCKRF